MGKKGKRNQQNRKPLVTTAPTTPSVVQTPIVHKAVASPPTAASPIVAPPVSKSAVTPPQSKIPAIGTIVSVTKNNAGTTSIFGKIQTPEGELRIHHSQSKIPAIGSIVSYETYEHEGRPAAKVIEVVGIDESIKARYDEIQKLGIYMIVDPATLLNSETIDPKIAGVTTTGYIVYLVE